MEHPYIRAYWFAGLMVIIITVMIIFSKAFKIRKKVKDFFLSFFILSIILVVYVVLDRLIIERDTSNLIYPLEILIGLAYGNFEFFIMKGRLKKNTINNTFFIPSIFFFIIFSFASPLLFLPFYHVIDFKLLRSRIAFFVINFLIGYSGVLYCRFLLLERKIGTIYFAKKYRGFTLRRESNNDKDPESKPTS